MANYRELPGSPTEHFQPDNITCERRFQCLWDERYTVFGQLYNTVYPFHSYQDLLCRNIDIDPFDAQCLEQIQGDSRYAKYQEAILTCQYELVQGAAADPQNPGGNNPMQMQFFEESWEESAQFLTVDGAKFKWYLKGSGSDVEPVDNPAMLVTMSDWNLTYYEIPNYALPNMDQFMGKVNDGPCYSPTLNKIFQHETLLFHPWTLRRSVSTTSANWTMDVKLTHNPAGWNLFPCPDWAVLVAKYGTDITNIFKEPFLPMVSSDGTQWKPYPKTSFAAILPPPI